MRISIAALAAIAATSLCGLRDASHAIVPGDHRGASRHLRQSDGLLRRSVRLSVQRLAAARQCGRGRRSLESGVRFPQRAQPVRRLRAAGREGALPHPRQEPLRRKNGNDKVGCLLSGRRAARRHVHRRAHDRTRRPAARARARNRRAAMPDSPFRSASTRPSSRSKYLVVFTPAALLGAPPDSRREGDMLSPEALAWIERRGEAALAGLALRTAADHGGAGNRGGGKRGTGAANQPVAGSTNSTIAFSTSGAARMSRWPLPLVVITLSPGQAFASASAST